MKHNLVDVIEGIERAIDEGAYTIREIKKQLEYEYPETTIMEGLNTANISLKTVKEKIISGKIRDAIEEGAESISEIKRETGHSYLTIKKYAGIADIELPDGRKDRGLGDVAVEKIKKAIEEGAESISEIKRETGHSYLTINKYAEIAGITLPKGRSGRKMKIDKKGFRDISTYKNGSIVLEGIEQELTLEGIAELIKKETHSRKKMSKENIRIMIRDSGNYYMWREKRDKVIEKKRNEKNKFKKTLNDISDCFKGLRLRKAKEESWEHGKAYDYFYNKKRHTKFEIKLEKLIEFFSEYKKCKDEGIRASYIELGEKAGITFTHVGYIFKKMNLPSLYWNIKERKIPSQEEEEMLKRARDELWNFSSTDIAYFMGINHWLIDTRFRGREDAEPFCVYFGLHEKTFTYAIASQIYEARALHFKKDEIIELLDISEDKYNYAIKHRKKTEPEIVHALQVLFPNENHQKPYRWN